MALKCLFTSQSIALAKGQQRLLEGEGSRGQKVKEWVGVGLRSADLTWRSAGSQGCLFRRSDKVRLVLKLCYLNRAPGKCVEGDTFRAALGG